MSEATVMSSEMIVWYKTHTNDYGFKAICNSHEAIRAELDKLRQERDAEIERLRTGISKVIKELEDLDDVTGTMAQSGNMLRILTATVTDLPSTHRCDRCFGEGRLLEDHDGKCGYGMCPDCNGTGNILGGSK